MTLSMKFEGGSLDGNPVITVLVFPCIVHAFLVDNTNDLFLNCQVALAVRWYPFIHLAGKKHCESKVSCPRLNTTLLDPATAHSLTFYNNA